MCANDLARRHPSGLVVAIVLDEFFADAGSVGEDPPPALADRSHDLTTQVESRTLARRAWRGVFLLRWRASSQNRRPFSNRDFRRGCFWFAASDFRRGFFSFFFGPDVAFAAGFAPTPADASAPSPQTAEAEPLAVRPLVASAFFSAAASISLCCCSIICIFDTASAFASVLWAWPSEL